MQILHRNEFGTLLNTLGLTGNGAELGVQRGEYSEVLLRTSKLHRLYLVDVWRHLPDTEYIDITNQADTVREQEYQQTLTRVAPYAPRAVVLREDLRVAIRRFPRDYFDFIYIDANHRYESVRADMLAWYPKLKSGGVFAGHDYTDGRSRNGLYGVKRAVTEFVSPLGVQLYLTPDRAQSWYWVKP